VKIAAEYSTAVVFFGATAATAAVDAVENEDQQAAEFQQLEADAKFMVSAQGITTGTKAHLSKYFPSRHLFMN